MPVGVQDREGDGGVVVAQQHDVGLLAAFEAAQLVVAAEGFRAAAGGPVDDVLGAQLVRGDGLAAGVRLQVLAGAVGAQRAAHGGEQVTAPPHAGVHRERDRDAVVAQCPGGRVALTRALLALRGHRHRAAAGGDAVVGVGGERRRVHEDARLVQEPGLVGEPDAVVVGRAPDTGVRGDGDAQLARHLVGGPLRELRVPGHVERHLEAEHVVAGLDDALGERREVRRGRPLPRRLLDVAVGEDEPAGHRAQRVDRRLGVQRGLQPVRPVHAGRDAGVDRLQRCEQVAGADVLRAEVLTGLEVVPDEVLRQRPVGAVAAHRRLPHVPVRVDHAGHDDAAARVDLLGAFGHLESRSHLRDAVTHDEHVPLGEHRVRIVHREHQAAAQHHRTSGLAHGSPSGRRSDHCPPDGQRVG
ncbi:hypothetical protein SAMN05443637_101409 [Pseudonocardia thermophila]|uniref:Uncharacterized protein n=1 Tax=Pseudonocardia thermophila TaxID=1848 RepID=A0A1M6NQQ0_PSETH|nr:hypothetical protein SAMN05443637_101409 [Pseudonocardia thermophila]